MLISTGWWKRFYDEGDGGSADGDASDAGASSGDQPAGSTEGGDPGDVGAGGGDAGGSDGAGGGSDAGGMGQAGGASAAQAAPQDPSAGLLDYVRDRFGVDLGRKYQNGEQAIQGLLNAARLVGQRSQEAELGRRFAGYETEFQQFLRERQEQAAKQAQVVGQQQAQEPWWNPPAYDESWQRWISRDAEGNATLREDTPLEVRRAIEERRTYLERWQHQLHTDPAKALQAPLEQFRQQVRDEVLEEIRWQQQQQQQTQYASQFVNQNAEWIYQKAGNGDYVRDFQTGAPVPTQAGAYFIQSLMQLNQGGMQDQALMVQTALQMTRGAMAAIQAQGSQQGSQQGTQPGTGAAPGAGAAPHQAAGNATGAAAPPPATQRRRQPTAGVLPGETRVSGGRGMSLREMLVASASDLPEREFADQE